ncbi:MAG: hypothetical protein AAGU27_14750 [Dehalobacterium sp.]
MIVLYTVAWVLLGILALMVLILLVPIKYDLRGYWQEKFSGIVKIGIGPLQGLVKWAVDGNTIFALQLAGITLMKKPLSKNTEKKEKKEKKKEPTPAKKEKRGKSWNIFDFLEKDFIKAGFRMVGDILRHSSPQVMDLKGVWGFGDPYYTGILAALKTVIPSIHVEPDFTGEVRDLKVLVQGRIRPVVLLFYGLRFIISSAVRAIWKKMRQKRKIKIKNNATNRKSPVY